jgi:uncharacterized cupredoxin-like copper-binding protein
MPFPVRSAAVCAVLAMGAVPAIASAASTTSAKLSEFKIAVGHKSAEHGKVTFTVANTGKFKHELVVIKTSTPAAKLPVSGGQASEKGSVGEVELAAGKSKRLTLSLAKGHYALICNLPGHYKGGMRTDLTVR